MEWKRQKTDVIEANMMNRFCNKKKKKIKRERERKDKREKRKRIRIFRVAILLQTKSAVLFSVVVEPREFCSKI